MSKKPALAAKKSFRDGHVSIAISLKAQGFGDHATIAGSTELTTEEARTLALELAQQADAMDAKVAAKAAKEDRRRKWRDREIAAGRMRVFTPEEFFNRGR